MKTQKLSQLVYAALFLLVGFGGSAQETSELSSKKFQVSLVYPVGSNGQKSHQVSNTFSLNMIAGYNGSVRAFELGGVYNIISGNVKGTQISGFGNTVGGNASGFQLAGFMNTSKGSLQGAQIAGFTNPVANDITGFQLAGFLNATKGSVVGTQIAGFLNITAQDVQGVQLAGFSNMTGGSSRTQVSGFLNKTDSLSGAQVSGFLNIANQVKGVQFGVINLADSVKKGTQIGLVNLSENGFISLGLDTDDNIPYQVAFRSGMDHFYTVIFAGVHADEDFWAAGAGFGSRIFISPKRSFFINPELKWAQIIDGKVKYDKFSHLTKVNVNLGYQFNNNFFITGGPSSNFYVTNYLDETGQPVIDLSENLTIDDRNGAYKHQFWIGYSVGMGFKF